MARSSVLHYVKKMFLILSAILFIGNSYSSDSVGSSEKTVNEKINQLKSSATKYMDGWEPVKPIGMVDKGMLPKGVKPATHEDAVNKYMEDRGDLLGLYNIKDADAEIYIFISMSMPDAMLRGYALEAAKTGAVLVLRGVSSGQDMKTFIQKTMSPMVLKNLGVLSTVKIDPRLFDVYNIQSVPTMILDEKPSSDPCESGIEMKGHTFRDGSSVRYQGCKNDKEKDHIYRLTGATTLLYALEQFAENGSKEALKRMNMMREIEMGKSDKKASSLTEQELEEHVKRATAKIEKRIRNP